MIQYIIGEIMDKSTLLELMIKTESYCGITATLLLFYGTNIRMKIAYSRKQH